MYIRNRVLIVVDLDVLLELAVFVPVFDFDEILDVRI